jgi:hypothetical protein
LIEIPPRTPFRGRFCHWPGLFYQIHTTTAVYIFEYRK